MKINVIDLANDWIKQPNPIPNYLNEFYCATRDIFQSRLDAVLPELLKITKEDKAYFLYAIIGEIGNNSFDHNIGNWRDIPGVFFAFDSESKVVILADRGQGILTTLKKVKPELDNDVDALKLAFTEKISGRAPENRGNGLKFVNENITNNNFHLIFKSGHGEIEINQVMNLKENSSQINGCLAIINF